MATKKRTTAKGGAKKKKSKKPAKKSKAKKSPAKAKKSIKKTAATKTAKKVAARRTGKKAPVGGATAAAAAACTLTAATTGVLVSRCAPQALDVGFTLSEAGIDSENQRTAFRDCVFQRVLDAGCFIDRDAIPPDGDTTLRDVVFAILETI